MAEPDIRVLVSNTGDASPDGKSASKIRDNLQKAFNAKPAYLKVEMHSKSTHEIKTALQNVKIKASLAPDTPRLLQQQLDVLSKTLKLNLSATVGNAAGGASGAQGNIPFSNFDGAAVSTKAMSQSTAELTRNRIANANAMAQENLRAQEQINDLKIQAAESRAAAAATRAQEVQSRANANAKAKETAAIDKNNKAQSDSNKMLAQFNEYLATLKPKALIEFEDSIAKIRDLLGEGTPDALKNARNSLNDFKADMKHLGYEGGNVFTYLQDKIRTFATYLASSTLTMGVVSTFGNVVSTVKDLDAALTDLQIVTGGTNAETKELLATYNQMAQKLGSTTAEVASGATDWLRQGYGQADSAELLKQSMTLSIVGDMNSADATNALTAAMKGYQLAVEDASDVVDKFFKVDMAAATSSADMAEALAKTAANAKLAGISLDDVIGQLAVVNETLKEDGSSTGCVNSLAA